VTVASVPLRARIVDDDGTGHDAPAVAIRELSKRFAARAGLADLLRFRPRTFTTVVDRVTFDVSPGEIFGVLGPNGAGKTTLFKMLSTLVVPDAGTATVRGKDVRTEPAAVRRELAAVSSDERSLNWRLSARENLALFAALHRVPAAKTGESVSRALETVGLPSASRKLVGEFSSGMRQRLLIARALLARPGVLLLDEPTRALDPISAQAFRTFLREELVRRHACTIVLATHNADEALCFCDRVLVLNRGRVLAVGTARDLATRFGEERYRILTTEPDHEGFTRLENLGTIRRLPTRAPTIDGWQMVECAIPGGPANSASVLRALVESGASVSRLERVEPSLADLIGRIITTSAAPDDHA
jgi:ABC-2 type transport system ATP-binding protein